jgi:lysophospholipase L1-like esterase
MSDAPPPVEAAPRRRLSIRKKLAFLSVVLILGVCGIEGVLRILGYPKGLMKSTRKMWATDDERALGPFKPDAEVKVAWPPELTYTAKINALGLRGPLPATGKPVVLCVGDSTTFGSYVEEDDTYPRQLQDRLSASSIVNAGVPRWTITDEVEFLAEALPQLEPRAVVILFCGNDLVELDKAPARERALRSRGWWSDLRTRLAIPEVMLNVSLSLRRSYLESRGRWPPEMRADQMETGDWARPYWARYAKGLTEAVALCRQHKARLLVGAFPGFKELESDVCEVERTLPQLVREAGAEYVDLYAPFRASPKDRFLLPLDAHASGHGNALIAEVFAKALNRP